MHQITSQQDKNDEGDDQLTRLGYEYRDYYSGLSAGFLSLTSMGGWSFRRNT